MAVRPISITGDPVLHSPASPVPLVDDGLRTLVRDMFETMDAAPGVGLAAPQVGVGLRLFVWSWVDDDGQGSRGVAVNPTLWQTPLGIEPLDDEGESEGCLSIPGERFPLRRADRVLLRATDLEGEQFEVEAQGWLARIFQHEYDHLDGVLYADRLEHPFHKAAAKQVKRSSWGVPGKTWLPGVDDRDAWGLPPATTRGGALRVTTVARLPWAVASPHARTPGPRGRSRRRARAGPTRTAPTPHHATRRHARRGMRKGPAGGAAGPSLPELDSNQQPAG